MAAVRCWLALAAVVRLFSAPSYTAIVNAASNLPGPLAPYTLATIYGTDLAYSTLASDLNAGALRLGGVVVNVDGQAAPLYYVSPRQINFLVPYNTGLTWPTEVNLTVSVDGRAGPTVRVTLREAAPALFQRDRETVLAAHGADWTPVTKEAPARPDEWVILFATGLGRTNPPVAYPQLAQEAARVQASVLLAGAPLPAESVAYAGVMPGYAGLYQINVRLPARLDKDPEVQIAVAGATSPADLRLPCAP